MLIIKARILLATAKMPEFQVYILYHTALNVVWNGSGIRRVATVDTLCQQPRDLLVNNYAKIVTNFKKMYFPFNILRDK